MTALHLVVGQTWIDFIPLILALFILPLFSIYGSRRIAKNPDASLVPRYLQTLIRGWLMVGIVITIWWKAGRPFRDLGLDMPIGPLGLCGLLFCAVLVVLIGVQHRSFARRMKPERVAKMRSQMGNIKILPRNVSELLVFLFVAITAGIWEELVYRGFLFWILTPYVSVIGAVILSTAVFGLGHAYQGVRGMWTTGIVGLVLGIAFALTHSLWWLMVAHAIIDMNGGLAAFRVMRMPESQAA